MDCYGELILQDVTGLEFKILMGFVKSLNIFGDKAPTERVELIESQADLDAPFDVSVLDGEYIDRLISCLYMALPFFLLKIICRGRGASSSKFTNFLNKNILPIFDKAPNVTNSLCGYKIVTCQPSDRLGEDFQNSTKISRKIYSDGRSQKF
ncbi:putative apoptosis inhibitory 5 [Helianthus annuus]|nr:putative apoptosis inhibitory 5 [Helianthus annuus]